MKKSNPLVWGAVGAIIVSALYFFNKAIGTPPSSNELLQSPLSVAVVAFCIGFALANIRNWYGNRLNR